MTFGQSISTVISKYATFSGRAQRTEYWWWYLFSVLLGGVCTFLDIRLFGGTPWVQSIVGIALFLPGLAVFVRRLHDRDKSGLWCLLMLIPLVGWVILLVWCCKAGTDGDNRFGPNPLG